MQGSDGLTIKVDGKREIELLISIINLGIYLALKEGLIGIEDAERYLYSPYTMSQLERLNIRQELIDIIHLGTELEDVQSLLPEKLGDSLEEIKQETIKTMHLLAENPSKNPSTKKWIQM